MEFLTGVVTKIGEMSVGKIVQHYQHLIHPNKSINKLRDECEQLSCMKQALQAQVNADRNIGHKIAPDVEYWLRKVEGIETKLQRLYEDEVREKNQWPRYSLSRGATKRGAEVLSLLESRAKLQIISYPASPPRAGEIFTANIKGFQSRTKIIMEVIEKLKNDEFKRISICGMGGVGKTTMVTEVMKIAEANKLFDKVAFAVMSQNVDYRRVQGDIAGMLGLKFENETLQGRAGEILKRLKSINKVLIVLDDVWNEVDFECIGLPSSFEYHKGCKVLFTSRNQHVCNKMGSQENFPVPFLSSDETWDLFKEMAGSDICSQSDIYPIAKEIADECGGLPIAIVTVGKALVNKRKHTWKDVHYQLKNSPVTSFSELQSSVYSRIQLSYNFLDSEEHRDCLLLCSLFPEDFNIPIEVLMRHGLGLGLFKGVGKLLTARNRVHDLVDNLKTRFLLLDSEQNECVKMHDVVREAVTWIASKGQHGYVMQGGVQIERFKGDAFDYRAASLMLDNTEELPVGLDCSHYQLLQVASRNKKSILWPEDLFQGMTKLKVLSMEELCIPKPLSVFKALHSLWTLRLENCDVGDISIIGKELNKLGILSVAYSNIKQLPSEIGQLSSLRLLDLTGCYYLYKIHSNVLACLSQLEELYIRVIDFPWQQNRAIMAELELLSHQLKVFEINVNKFEILPKDLVFENLERFWVYVGGRRWADYSRRGYIYSNTLEIRNVDCNFMKKNMLMNQLIKDCEILRLTRVKHLKNLNSIHQINESKLSGLNYLEVVSCDDLEFLIATKSMVKFPNLKELLLNNLPNLFGFAKAIILDEPHRSIQAEGSRDSGIVEDKQHSFGAMLFTRDWLQQFPKLEKLFLHDCSSLDVVFDLQEYSELVGQVVALLFPQMKEIEIEKLSKLRHVWANVAPNVQGFENLRSLAIKSCGSLTYVFTPSIVKALKQLEKVKIRNCQSIEEVVSTGIEKGKAKTVVFAKLDSLEMNNLPSLASFCSNFDSELVWPSLRHLSINRCHQLNASQIQKVIESAKQDNVGTPSNIGSSNITSEKGSTRFLKRCFGYANKSNIKVSSPNVVDVHNCDSKDANFVNGMEICFNSPMPILQHIDISDCDSMDAIFSHSKRISINSFAQVESFELNWLPNLVSLCHGTRDSPSFNNNHEFRGASNDGGTITRHIPFIDGFLFPNLSSLQIQGCHKINSLFSPSSSASLEHLRELDIRECDTIEGIVTGEKETQRREILFPKLRVLKLESLGNFMCFCSSSYNHLEFPSLEKISISNCPKIEELMCGSSITPKLQDVTISGENYEIKYKHKRDLNAIIRQYIALNVGLQTSEAMDWSSLNQGIVSCSIINHEKLLKIVPFDEISIFQHLQKLTVSYCTSLVEVFESKGVSKLDGKKKDYELKEMKLKNLPKLLHIWTSLISGFVSFANLTELNILQCHSLTSVLPLSMAQSLVQLQRLRVQECNMMEEIVVLEKKGTEKVNKIETIFPELRQLHLVCLPNLKWFCSATYDIELPSCHEMVIEKCSNMATFIHGTVSTPKLPYILTEDKPSPTYAYFFYATSIRTRTMGDLNSTIYYIQNARVFEEQMQKSETFGWIEHNKHLLSYITRVTELYLQDYESLLNCVPSNMMHRFQHLEELNIKECDSIVEIFESEGVDVNDKEHGSIMLYELKRMYLQSLPKLASIWKSHHAWVLGFQNLWRLEVKSCHNLKSVFPLSIAKSLPNLQQLKVWDCEMMEEIVAFKIDEGDKISQEPNDINVMIFPSLRVLVLKDLPSLKCFCTGPCDFELPHCWMMIIKNCTKMESFCDGITFTPQLDNLSIEDSKYEYPEEGLDAIIQWHYQT